MPLHSIPKSKSIQKNNMPNRISIPKNHASLSDPQRRRLLNTDSTIVCRFGAIRNLMYGVPEKWNFLNSKTSARMWLYWFIDSYLFDDGAHQIDIGESTWLRRDKIAEKLGYKPDTIKAAEMALIDNGLCQIGSAYVGRNRIRYIGLTDQAIEWISENNTKGTDIPLEKGTDIPLEKGTDIPLEKGTDIPMITSPSSDSVPNRFIQYDDGLKSKPGNDYKTPPPKQNNDIQFQAEELKNLLKYRTTEKYIPFGPCEDFMRQSIQKFGYESCLKVMDENIKYGGAYAWGYDFKKSLTALFEQGSDEQEEYEVAEASEVPF